MNDCPVFDANLMRRYRQAGAPCGRVVPLPSFLETAGDAAFRDLVRRSNRELVPRPLALSIHTTAAARATSGEPDTLREVRRDRAGRPFIERLLREIEIAGRMFDRDREVVALQFDPISTFSLSHHQLEELLEGVDRNFHLRRRVNREFAVRLDPMATSAREVGALARLGFNRATVLADANGAPVERGQEWLIEAVETVVDSCRASGFRSVTLRVPFGSSSSARGERERDLERMLATRPDRVHLWPLTGLPRNPAIQPPTDVNGEPEADDWLVRSKAAVEQLLAARYRHLGMEQFALPDDDLARAQDARTLQCTSRGYAAFAGSDRLGLGVAAVSHIGDGLSQNYRDLASWARAIDEGWLPVWRGAELEFEDVVRTEVVQRLLCDGVIDTVALEHHYDLEFAACFPDAKDRLAALAADGLVSMRGPLIAATSRGRLVLRIIAGCFDRPRHEPRVAAHSVEQPAPI